MINIKKLQNQVLTYIGQDAKRISETATADYSSSSPKIGKNLNNSTNLDFYHIIKCLI